MANWRTKNSFLLTVVWNEESIEKDNGIEVIQGEKKRSKAKRVLSVEIQFVKETYHAKN